MKFAYKAMNRDGKEVFGVIDSDSQALAINDVKGLGLFPTVVREASKSDERRARKAKKGPGEFYIGGVKTKQIVVMTRQLSTLIDAGLPLLRSLNILIAQQKASKLKDILREVSSDIQSGSTFSDALSKHSKYFDRLYVNMVRAGEVGGMLEVVLQRLAIFMERRAALKRKVKGAMIYPIAVLLIATGIVWFLLTYIVPEFAEVFKEFGAKLPAMTLILMDIGDFARFKWWIVILTVTTTLNVIKILGKIKLTKRIMDRVVLKIPLVGDLVTKVAVARFARTLGTLITSGVPILQSLKITKETIGNEVIENAIQKVHDSIKDGDTIAAPLDESKVFPAMVVNMIDVGEETGSLDSMLMKVADIYDAEVEAAVEAMLRLMEPIIIIV
ncbi:MAG: type II secretion system F family protein, partial [Candidatus Hydrogenedentes bacterium]|nr:type II secretion system F family protein [Candidatus Hydrogenedentota bacterium]